MAALEDPGPRAHRTVAQTMAELRAPIIADAERQRQAEHDAAMKREAERQERYKNFSDPIKFDEYLTRFLAKTVRPALEAAAARGGHTVIFKSKDSTETYMPNSHHYLFQHVGKEGVIDSNIAHAATWEGRFHNPFIDQLKEKLERYCARNKLYGAIIKCAESHECWSSLTGSSTWNTYLTLEIWISDGGLTSYLSDRSKLPSKGRVFVDSRNVSIEDNTKHMTYD